MEDQNNKFIGMIGLGYWGKIFSVIFMTLEFSIQPVIPIRGLSPKGRKDFRDVFVEKWIRERINSHDKGRQR